MKVWQLWDCFTTFAKLTPINGHGEKSVYMLSGFIKLTREEAVAINWHMSGFDVRVKGGSYSLSDAYYKYPVAVLLAMADMMSAYLDEKIYK